VLQPSLLVLGVIDDVENMRKLAFIGLPAQHKEQDEGEDGNCWLKVLPIGELGEFALYF
jgi:hypothetical protein